MTYSIFADESGTGRKHKCYSIGALKIQNSRLPRFEVWFSELRKRHGYKFEIGWENVSTSHGLINLGIELLTGLLKTKCQIGFIVVKKSGYRNWQSNEEKAFYKTYTMLIHDQMKADKDTHQVYIDDKSDAYPKHAEIMEAVGKNMLNRIQAGSSIEFVKKTDSKLMSGIQAIDLLTGAVNASHNLYLDPEWKHHMGKDLLIRKLAEIIGWDKLHYDTYPNEKPNPNIWHFPHDGYRKVPKSGHIIFNPNVSYIKPEDLRRKSG